MVPAPSNSIPHAARVQSYGERFRRVVRIIVAVLAVPTMGGAQEAAPGPASACVRCRISLELVGRLGAESDDASPARSFFLTERKDGTFLLAPSEHGGQLLIYGAGGRLLRSFGKQGPGPGEFGVIAGATIGRGDSIHVFEHAPRRVSVFDSNLTYARSAPIPAVPLVPPHALPNGDYLVHQFISRPDILGVPLHVMTGDGDVVRSFGGDGIDFRPDTRVQHRRLTSLGADGSIWSAHFARYRIDNYSAAGKLIRTLERPVSWFEPWTGEFIQPHIKRPPTTIRAVWPIDGDRILVVLSIADARWRQGGTAPKGNREDPNNPGFAPENEYANYFDTIFEIIRVSDGTVLQHHRVNGALFPTATQGLLYTPRETPAGARVLDLWRIRLH